MFGHSKRKTLLALLMLGVAFVTVVLLLKPNVIQETHKQLEQNGAQMVAKFKVVFPSIIRPQSNRTFTEETIKLPNDTSYWEKKMSQIYDVPDPLSSLIGRDNVTFPNKYVIYRCDNATMKHCGGWADRVKSMLTVYLLANMTGRVFKAEVIMEDCDLQRFVVPNRVNWSLPVSFHKTVNLSEHVAKLDMFSQPHFYPEFRRTDWVHHPMLSADFVYIKSNHDNADNFREYKLHPYSLQWTHNQNRVSVNQFLFKRLFKPSDYLRNKLINFLTENVKPDEKLFCAHLRMGRNPTIPEDFRLSIHERHLPRVWRLFKTLIARSRRKFKIFLMSDSESAIAKAQSQDFKDKVFVAPGKIVHVELSESSNAQQKCDGLEKVIFEQQILLHCNRLVITDSGLSRMASYVRGGDDGLYCLKSTGSLFPCRPIHLKTIYNTVN